jgi:hypothetical protein
MNKVAIKTESFPERCEICHQSDLFDPIANNCQRCDGILEKIKKDIPINISAPTFPTLVNIDRQRGLFQRLVATMADAIKDFSTGIRNRDISEVITTIITSLINFIFSKQLFAILATVIVFFLLLLTGLILLLSILITFLAGANFIFPLIVAIISGAILYGLFLLIIKLINILHAD